MLDWSMLNLAEAARVSVSTVRRVESGSRWSGLGAAIDAFRDALEAEGIRFLADEGTGLGIRLVKG